MSIKELSVSNSFSNGGNVYGPIDIYAKTVHSLELDVNSIDAVGANIGGILNASIVIANSLTATTSASLNRPFISESTSARSTVTFGGTGDVTLTPAQFVGGIFVVKAATGNVTVPDLATLDTYMGTTGTAGPVIYIDIINQDHVNGHTLIEQNGNVINIQKPGAAGAQSYQRYYFAKFGAGLFWTSINAS